MKRAPRDLLRHILGRPAFVFVAILLGLLLTSPSLGGGLSSDDHIQRMWVKGEYHCLDLFTFSPGDEALMRLQKAGGTMPWYADDRLKISFFRPLASLSHCIDYRYLDAFPKLLHAQNLLWLGLAIGATFSLYRRTASSFWIAGLATLFFAIDEAHGKSVGWLANRNTLMATSFGMLAMALHHRARLGASRKSAWLAPLAFLAALFSAEAAVAVLAYLASHALFLDRGRVLSRARALLPYVAVVVAWRIAYVALDHGQHGSALYTDPITQPARFLAAVIERAPVLLFAQLGGPSSDFFSIVGKEERKTAWIVALASLAIVTIVLLPLLRKRKEARFFAFGMLLSLVPACATLPGDRLLMLAGVGGMGLVAEFVGALLEAGSELWRSWFFRLPAFALLGYWTLVHALLAPLRLPGQSVAIADTGNILSSAGESLFANVEPKSGVLVLHGGGNMYACTFASFLGHSLGYSQGSSAQCFYAGEGAVTVMRVGANRLALRPEGGFVDLAREPFWNADKPMQVGEQIDLGWLRITVTGVSNTGEPLEAMFQLPDNLESPRFHFRYWSPREGRYIEAPLPPVWGRYTIAGGEIVDFERAQQGASAPKGE